MRICRGSIALAMLATCVLLWSACGGGTAPPTPYPTYTPYPTDTTVVVETPTPEPTLTPASTATPTPPSPTPPAPSPTAVPPSPTPIPPTPTTIPPTPTVAGQAPTSTPALEPVSFLLRASNRYETVLAHQPVIAKTRWGVCQAEAMQDHLDAGTFQITIDGQVRASGNLSEYRGEVLQEDWGTGAVWVVYYAYPMGAFEAGSFHWLELERGYSRPVTDGCDVDGDGAPDMYGPGYHEFPAVRLEVAVQ